MALSDDLRERVVRAVVEGGMSLFGLIRRRLRRAWFAGQLDLDPARLVFIDETGASTNMARKRGRCRRGRRLRAAVPQGHYKTVTLIAGLRLRGLVAQKAFDRPINAASFEEWVEKCLVPTLSKGDIVVMDNLSSHKGERVERLIKAARAELRYLPPYSPDMNPIKKAYSKMKASCAKSPNEPSPAC
jgi:transposase